MVAETDRRTVTTPVGELAPGQTVPIRLDLAALADPSGDPVTVQLTLRQNGRNLTVEPAMPTVVVRSN